MQQFEIEAVKQQEQPEGGVKFICILSLITPHFLSCKPLMDLGVVGFIRSKLVDEGNQNTT